MVQSSEDTTIAQVKSDPKSAMDMLKNKNPKCSLGQLS
jgi:hypothetical protein